ncbi:S-adenosyl-L-methionine-dependent methyltransferase [Dunaliella salina]|uniref:S-adenosyl-L-methionine-dependent methyltransferase n=1 Tax=Dunaliella salina TaxID=3046 RepID=A0ABQ7G581_DUNSA|nr:S-adenosyl-L-methionine-dependent methyltransferase [Dunaliella salina]|eukprot:KAF5829758.1 S-adenosyl-L-methionine-dependent methyltransferase [Dunaliella salina]
MSIMRYLSLFSGIGGFEVAIHQVFGDKAECVGYSEIDKHAIAEYESHYPNHVNLGDITKLKKNDIDSLDKIDLIVGGFPCSDLSSANDQNRKGLNGQKSGLFWIMCNVIMWARTQNPNLQIIIENNASMAHKWRDMITNKLCIVLKQTLYCNFFDSSQWVMQRRRRYYWTLKQIPEYYGTRKQSMNDVLVPINEAKQYKLKANAIMFLNSSPPHLHGYKGEIISIKGSCYKKKSVEYPTRLSNFGYSTTLDDYVKCLVTRYQSCFLLDYRLCSREHMFIPRYLAKSEFNRLFGYPENYVYTNRNSVYARLYGMTVVPPVVKHILLNL